MNILMLNYEYPPLGGGAGVVTRYHAEGLARLGHEVTVVTTWFEGEKDVEVKETLKIIRLRSKRKYTYKSTPDEWISWISASKKFMNEYCINHHFDVNITHFALPGGEVACYLKKKFNIPYLIVSHGHDIPWFFPKQMFFYHLISYFWIKRNCNAASRLVVLSNMMKENGDKFLSNRKKDVVVIPNACEVNTFVPDVAKKSKVFKIIFVGRHVEQKDPMTFLKAIHLFKEKNQIDFIVNVLGDGPMRKEMEEFVNSHHLQDKVHFLGWVNKVQMLQEYQSANVQVMPSLIEAMSIAILESLSTGLYVISTPVSGNTDVIEEGINGDFIKIGDAVDLAEKIQTFYHQKFLTSYQVDATFLEKFRKKYTWNLVVETYEQLLNQIISDKAEVTIKS